MAVPVSQPPPANIGQASLPEGAWLRLVSQLDYATCCALTSTESSARQGTAAALEKLKQVGLEGEAQYRQAMEAIEAEERAVAQRAQAERATAAAALAHLAPLRAGTLAQRYGEQLQQIFTELETAIPNAATDREAEAAAARRAREQEATESRQQLESEARENIAEGVLNAGEESR
eukprot:gnl/TRDRNA2_/TRDRNA2_153328_c0_seq4.p1 gnl/TRDRNA2_/TRDRNA2_153328_c0~~gnl/TRDRNA2_/TRDRNA2_153328_c0_seq4.p1  ORF type:complete len:176 (-),score=43.12 gnl/TRDRNA2_/TRDRNA2_153328_c0_seq4:79-606(-)